MRKVFYFFLILLFPLSLSAQNYYYLVADADSLQKIGDFRHAAADLDSATGTWHSLATDQDYLQAAICNVHIGNFDEAYHLLMSAIGVGYINTDYLETAPIFQQLRNDTAKWGPVSRMAANARSISESQWNKPLKAEFESMYDEYHHLELLADSIRKQYGIQSPRLAHIDSLVKMDDSVYLKRIVRMFYDSVGVYPSIEKVGKKANSVMWLVFQHANYGMQSLFYQGLVAVSLFSNDERPYMAMFEDRMCTNVGQKQLYGSVFVPVPGSDKEYQFLDIIDLEHLDQRRISMRLPPLELFARKNNIRLPKGYKPRSRYNY